MNNKDIYNHLCDLIEQSDGEPIMLPSGETHCFIRKRSYAERELSDWEKTNKIKLPREYRSFLLQVGACKIFYGGSCGLQGVEFHALEEIRKTYGKWFDDPKFLISEILPVAYDNNLQELAIYAIKRKPPFNVALIWHEYPPEVWLSVSDETPRGWKTFRAWLQMLIESEGEREL